MRSVIMRMMTRTRPAPMLIKILNNKKMGTKNLKLLLAIFYQIFIFSPNDSPLKTMKNVFYFIEKALFVLEIFKFL